MTKEFIEYHLSALPRDEVITESFETSSQRKIPIGCFRYRTYSIVNGERAYSGFTYPLAKKVKLEDISRLPYTRKLIPILELTGATDFVYIKGIAFYPFTSQDRILKEITNHL